MAEDIKLKRPHQHAANDFCAGLTPKLEERGQTVLPPGQVALLA